jgi:hypothetical protein
MRVYYNQGYWISEHFHYLVFWKKTKFLKLDLFYYMCSESRGNHIRHWASNCGHVGHVPALEALCCFVSVGWVILESWVTWHQWLHMWCMEALHQTVRQSSLPSYWLQCWIKNSWRDRGALLQLSYGSKKGKYDTRPRDADLMPKVWGPRPVGSYAFFLAYIRCCAFSAHNVWDLFG